jgi:hypothetical protein
VRVRGNDEISEEALVKVQSTLLRSSRANVRFDTTLVLIEYSPKNKIGKTY